jgi:hypothetical protein
MTDFFISYTSADQVWAEWIGYILEEEGFSVIIQAWDFRPGSNFVLEMQRAASGAARTIMVLSPDYLSSQFASPEWAAAFASDPRGLERRLIPVVVRKCHTPGLLNSIVHISLVDENEVSARRRLIEGLSAKRAKPIERPAFPGAADQRVHKPFPRPSTHEEEVSIPISAIQTDLRPDIDARSAFFQILEKSEWTQQQIKRTKDTTNLVRNWLEVRLDDEIHKALISGRLEAWGDEILPTGGIAPERLMPCEIWRQVEIVFDRLTVHRTSAHWRTSGRGKMAWVGIKFSQHQIFSVFPLVSAGSYDFPVHKAVAHVASAIGDADASEYFPRARLEIRQAAFNGSVIIWGNKSAKKMGGGLGRNAIASPIPKEYWETAEITHMATDPLVDDHFHTFPHRYTDGMFGEEISLYAKLRMNWDEIVKRWPIT